MDNQEAISILKTWRVTGDKAHEALDMAISALQEKDVPDTNVGDMVSRRAVLEINEGYRGKMPNEINHKIWREIKNMPPSVLPEPSGITDEQAILHLQSTGWMQNHDREMYESGLRKQLADDSGSYDSLIPCEDTISRAAAIDAVNSIDNLDAKVRGGIYFKLIGLPSAQPELCEGAVSRTELLRIFEENCYPVHYDHNSIDVGMTLPGIVEVLNIATSVTPKRETGEWIEQDDGWDGVYYECSCCKEAFTLIDGTPSDNLYNFCPNCGAVMRKENR